jgi:hypothetical protein
VIPLYSGILGVFMPEKKLIPLSLLPLDIEITFNPHALYSSGMSDGAVVFDGMAKYPRSQGSRDYVITDFALYANMTYFELEI